VNVHHGLSPARISDVLHPHQPVPGVVRVAIAPPLAAIDRDLAPPNVPHFFMRDGQRRLHKMRSLDAISLYIILLQ